MAWLFGSPAPTKTRNSTRATLVSRIAARSRSCPRYYWLTKQDNTRARALYDKVARFVGFIRYDYPMG